MHILILFEMLLLACLVLWLGYRILSRIIMTNTWWVSPPTFLPNLRIMIGQMAMVASQNLPMATGLMLAAESEHGATGRVLKRIAKLLAEGLDVHTALERGYPQCPRIVVSVACAAEKAGRLPAALKLIEQYLVDRHRRKQQLMPATRLYALTVFVFLIFIWMGVMVVVVPKFQVIFADFGVRLPGLTIAIIKLSEWVVQGAGPFLVVGIPLLVIMLMYLRMRPRRPDRPRLTSRIADQIRWHTPVLGRLTCAEGLSVVIPLLCLFAEAGISLDRAARLVAEVDVNVVLRRRLERFADLVAKGVAPPQAANQAKLGNVLAVALSAGQFGNQLDTALQYAADYYHSLSSRFSMVLRNLSWPVVVLGLALLVGTFVVSLFIPLVTLINSVAGQV